MTDAFKTFVKKYYEFTLPYRQSEYRIRPIGKKNYVTEIDVFNDYRTKLEALGQEVDTTADEVVEYLLRCKPKVEKTDQKSPKQFIDEWFESHKDVWTYSNGMRSFSYIRGGVPTNKTILDVKEAIMGDVYNNNLPYKSEAISTVLNCKVRDENQNAVVNMFKNITYDQNATEVGKHFLKGMFDYFKPAEGFDIFDTIMSHWGWMVKRRILNLPVVNSIMPSLCGETGLGKTLSLQRWFAPMHDYTIITDLSVIFNATKEMGKLTDNYILLFDELSINSENISSDSLTDDQNNTLKSMLTKDELDVRIYSTQKQAKLKITFSPISTSNKHMYDIIYDPTSMRRYFEFTCTGKKPTDSFNAVNTLLKNEALSWWKSIDENLDRGYWFPNSTIGELISKYQANYYPTGTTTCKWIKYCKVRPGKKSLSDAYTAYKFWCSRAGFTKLRNYDKFIEDIKHTIPDACNTDGCFYLDFDTKMDDNAVIRVTKSIPDMSIELQ